MSIRYNLLVDLCIYLAFFFFFVLTEKKIMKKNKGKSYYFMPGSIEIFVGDLQGFSYATAYFPSVELVLLAHCTVCITLMLMLQPFIFPSSLFSDNALQNIFSEYRLNNSNDTRSLAWLLFRYLLLLFLFPPLFLLQLLGSSADFVLSFCLRITN